MLPVETTIAKTKAPAVPAELRLRARKCIAHFVDRANREQGARLRMPTCSFDLRGRTAGKARHTNHVQLNAVLLMENVDHFIEQIIPHEVAHLVTFVKYPNASAHGEEWQSVMRAFGLQPLRLHSLDTSNSEVATALYRFRCACKTHEITPRQYRSSIAGNRYCLTCRHVLQYTGETKPAGQDWRRVALEPTEPPKLWVGEARRQRVVVRVSSPSRLPKRPKRPTPPTRPLTPLSTDGPSPAMLRYMEDLARSLRWTIPPEALKERRRASEFIDRAKAAKAAVPPESVPATPVGVEPPTEKQLAFARSIAARKRLAIPSEVLASKRAVSSWIDANK